MKLRFCPCRYGCASPGEKDQNGIDGTDPFAAKPDPGLITLLLRARRFNTTLADGEGVPFAALAQREGVAAPISCGSSASAIWRRISPRQSSMGGSRAICTVEKLLEHSRLPLAWH